jgi:hypothetical protein
MKKKLNVLRHDTISSMTIDLQIFFTHFLHISPIPLPIKEPLT